ncbi:hypothetical protein AJ79_00452 [Helicocarpus griseus UAMH5409]|uniref:Conidiation-specific protein 6 n=1 Tax=Helicocarpus griseus UAMH5409 TaxID=1447875 RepID=A0A2B7YAV2_9EURO|nr:hypothetical protein AJ79_00452 [Helicocarpus griseus UAMH5409]
MNPEEAANKARGYKAAMHNPNVSEQAKQHSREVLEGGLGGDTGLTDEGGKDPGNRARGLKAATHNPNVTEEGKKSAQEQLEDMEQQE